MALEFRHDGLVIRVDGDVVEIFQRGEFSHRLLLAGLAVGVQPTARGRLIVQFTSASGEVPLYEVQARTRTTLGSTVQMTIKTEAEPLFRQCFTQVGQLCGRPVVT